MKTLQHLCFVFLLSSACAFEFSPSIPTFYLNHVGISVSNLALQRNWYNQTLGFSNLLQFVGPMEIPAGTPAITPSSSQAQTIQSVKLQNPRTSAIVELIQLSSSTHSPRLNTSSLTASAVQGLFHFAFRVPNLKDTLWRLQEDGVRVVQPIAEGADEINNVSTTFAYISDPEGNLIELIEFC
ncbi:hypothetical protein CI102_739 [Trichoderma harzianum]|uniref:VOC domain-containing protein n=1 Tax=Trichoderma harzianum CBS 226.95 TaxID=983964 RepID=A0A2T4AA11_TRIHA|nr:hypothetical protein M431DRAFT_555292 [Trichoderma harzianum CBS 226.95]PKK54563.1 hypothetical protein CI102_739 [Trichoderma harzianum]PTB53930.1 hypothetical protein M431DRAFT_555292 [Trichoderma harzianum CBS 226.95]